MNDDPDTEHRAFACELAQWWFDCSPFHPATAKEFLAFAMEVEHYITNGGTVAFECSESLRKCVRGE